MALSDLSAAVLIGGRSRRMGRPKALLRLAPASPTLLEVVVARVRAVAAEVVLVGEPAWPLPVELSALPLVADRGGSAADGVVAALGAARHDRCLIVGCDMPLLDPALLAHMARRGGGEGGVIAVDRKGAHPLHAIWPREALPEVERLVAAGERSLSRLAEAAGLAPFDIEAAGRPAGWRWSVFNVNTPADLAVARSRREQG